MKEAAQFPYAGAIDADGHILEPPDVWEKYIDSQYRDRAIRKALGENVRQVYGL